MKSPNRLKPTWKSKSRNTSAKSKKKRSKSNKIRKRKKRKFSNSDEEFMDPNEHVNPQTPRAPQNTATNNFYSKRKKYGKTQSRNNSKVSQKTNDKSPPRKKQLFNRKKKDNSRRKYSSKKKRNLSGDKRGPKLTTLKTGARDTGSRAWNLLIGDKANEISQVYSQADLFFGKKSVLLLKSVKFGFDMDYVTGIQAEYLVGADWAVQAYEHAEDPGNIEVLKVDDPHKIKGDHFGFLNYFFENK
jgi:hypothetical protein